MHEPESYSCPFCNIYQDEGFYEKEVVLESTFCICLLGLNGNEGSGPTFLVISKEHYENIYELPNDVLSDAFELAKRVSLLMRSTFDIDGTTLWQHNEPAGNQEVWHFHIHVKGRIDGDSLYKKTSYRLTDTEREQLSSMLREATTDMALR